MSEPAGTQYGGFWVRFLALLVDSAIVFLVSALLLVGVAMALGREALVPAAFAVSLLGLLYWPVMHASGLQGTPGKAIVGLKVARLDGRRISILRSMWRELAKILSAAVFMLGYVMAAIMPRKQGLHDLVAATYVVREGPSRIIPALAIAIAGFGLPVFVGPMVVDAGVMKMMGTLAEGIGSADLMKQVPAPVQDLMKQALGPAQDLMKPAVRPAAPAPKAAPKPAPAPAPVAKAPAPKPEPVALAQPAPLPAEHAKPRVAAEPTKPKPPATKVVVARARAPAPVPPSSSKTGSGPRYNDLMTAVMYGDVGGVNELLKLGKWPDKPDSRGMTPLMAAAELGDVRTAEALLRAGASARRALPVAEKYGDGEMTALLKRYSAR
jgi:uncharacterized RDD family membrane protein YckC